MRTSLFRSVVAWAILLALAVSLAPSLAVAGEEPPSAGGASPEAWAAALSSPNLDSRRRAAFSLWQAGSAANGHAKALARALQDDDEYVRTTVEKVLARMEWQRAPGALERALPELAEALADERHAVRLAAANLIWLAGPIPNVVGGKPPPPELVPALVTALGDEQADVRANAAAALANLQGTATQALPALARSLLDANAKVRMWAVRATAWIDAETGPQTVLALANDQDPGVRAAVMEAAGSAQAEQAGAALPVLVDGLGDADAVVKRAAINGLWALGRPEALRPLVSVLQSDAAADLRGLAANALGGLGDPRAAPHLLEAMQGQAEVVRAGAASGLASLGPEGAAGVPRMIQVFEAGTASTKQRVATAIGMLAPWAHEALPALVGALAHEDPGVRSMAASALSALAGAGVSSKGLRQAALAGTKDAAPQVRQYCVSIISALAEDMPEAAPALLELLEAGDEAVGILPVLGALQRMGPNARMALPAVRKLASAAGPHQQAAAAALASIASEPKEVDAAVQVLIDSMKDDAQRAMAIHRLRSLGPRARRAALIMRFWMARESVWKLPAAATLLRMTDGAAKDAVSVLEQSLRSPDEAGAAMGALRDVGPEGAGLVPALLAHATDAGSSWRTGALRALKSIGAKGGAVKAAYVSARSDADPWVRRCGAEGLMALLRNNRSR